MSLNFEVIPKDLPITNPLLFSFLVIIDAIELNCKINGKSYRAFDKDLPAFEFAVNSWAVTEEIQTGEKYKQLSQNLLCALWKEKPDEDDCNLVWSKFPNDSDTERKHEMSFLYEFEDWRNRTFEELEQIISALTVGSDVNRFENGERAEFLSKIFNYSIESGVVNYVYAIDSTANKFYGVGATFTLLSPFKNCCPKISETKLQKSYFEALGFVFSDLY
jgi:hypothetical protein